jgi:hypothetical protein
MKYAVALLAVVFLLAIPGTTRSQTVPRNVLIEYFNGTWAEYGPFGDDSLVAFQSRWPNTKMIAYYIPSATAADPMETTDGNLVRDSLVANFCPGAVFDRIVWQVGTSTYSFILDWTLWEPAMDVRMTNSPATPISINVGATYDSIGRQVSGIATITALQAMSGKFMVTAVVTEDDLDYPQLKYTSTGNITLPSYLHTRVVRYMPLGAMGAVLTTTGFTANQVIYQPLSFTLPSGINWMKARLTVFVDVDLMLMYGHRYVQQAWQGPFTSFNITPVELISFTGESNSDGVRIAWRTATESSNRGWSLERRAVGDDAWSDLAFIEGAGTTRRGNAYDFVDRTASRGFVYDYRLRQTDFDGKTELSSVVRVSHAPIPLENGLSVAYPNPFALSTNLDIDLAADIPARVEIVDAMGRTLATLLDGHHTAGRQSVSWDGRDASGNAAPAGMYFARMTTPSGVYIRQLLKAR